MIALIHNAKLDKYAVLPRSVPLPEGWLHITEVANTAEARRAAYRLIIHSTREAKQGN